MPNTFNINGFDGNQGKIILGTKGTINITETHNAAAAQSTSGGNGRAQPECQKDAQHVASDDISNPVHVSSDEEELATDWVKEQRSNPKPDVITVNDDKFDKKKKQQLLNFYKEKCLKTAKDTYAMKHEVRGNCLIFNNECKQDMIAAKSLFKKLGFECKTYEDKTAGEMKVILKQESKEDYSSHDCVVIIITAHGREGGVYGKDCKRGEVVDIHDMTKQFCDIPSLAGKPKLFFVAACRGSQKDEGMETLANVPARVASASDVFIGSSTTRDYVTWIKDGDATYYIQAIVYVFARWAYKLELMDLMKKVVQLVHATPPHRSFVQVPEKTDTQTRDFYFFPGLYEGMPGL